MTTRPVVPTLIGAPFDAHSSFIRGAAQGPAALREALRSDSTNLWTEAGHDLAESMKDRGDAGSQKALSAEVAAILAEGGVPIVLGGDHSITYQCLLGLRPRHPKLTIVQIDAHPDLYDEYAGDRFSHACQFARIMEEKLADRLVQVGIRTMNGGQAAQRDRLGVDVIDMRAFAAGHRPVVGGPVYLSIDLDGIDPAFAPGVAHREPGGLTTREVIGIIQSLRNVVGADVVELNPSRDPADITAPLAAKLVKEIAARMLQA